MLYTNEIFPGSGDYIYDKPTRFYFNLELYVLSAIGAYHGASVKNIVDYSEHFNFNEVPISELQVEEILKTLRTDSKIYKKSNLWFKS